VIFLVSECLFIYLFLTQMNENPLQEDTEPSQATDGAQKPQPGTDSEPEKLMYIPENEGSHSALRELSGGGVPSNSRVDSGAKHPIVAPFAVKALKPGNAKPSEIILGELSPKSYLILELATNTLGIF
jgi:hypothetical protein